MIYSEAAYFEGVPVAHMVTWEEHRRLRRIKRVGSAFIEGALRASPQSRTVNLA